jgi:hypothetical protein
MCQQQIDGVGCQQHLLLVIVASTGQQQFKKQKLQQLKQKTKNKITS